MSTFPVARAPQATRYSSVHMAIRKLPSARFQADLAALDPDAVKQIQKIQIREWVAEDAYYTFRVAYWLSSAIGILALVLTLSGIYGVLSYVISQRTKEIGTFERMGASTRAVTGLVMKQSMRLAIAGAVAGCVLATAVSRVLASVLAVINTFDAAAYIGSVAGSGRLCGGGIFPFAPRLTH